MGSPGNCKLYTFFRSPRSVPKRVGIIEGLSDAHMTDHKNFSLTSGGACSDHFLPLESVAQGVNC